MDHEFEYLKHIGHMDQGGLRELMQAYGQDVWNFAYFLTKRPDLADDVTQEVFLRVYRNIGSFRGQSSIKTWLFSITRNTAINMQRSAFFRRVTLAGFMTDSRRSPSAEREAMLKEELNDIWQVVMKLPVKLREVLVLDAKYDMTTREMADMLGISQGTVKSRLSRAREKVNVMWREEMAYERV